MSLEKQALKLSTEQMQLLAMLRMKRPHGSKTEKQFIDKYIIMQLVDTKKNWFQDSFGNIHLHIPYINEKENDRYCLFSAHTDTVHQSDGEQIVMVNDNGIAYLNSKGSKGQAAFGQCLGADDGTGCWILVNMIARNIPGYYIFHRAEERGGRGSAFIRDNFQSLIKPKIKIALAFDRKGTDELITHQSGMRGASDACADLLITEFSKNGIKLVKSQHGTFTDTAHYFSHISECFNMSVGYQKQHGPNESQDLMFAEKLLHAVYRVNWRGLMAFRDPSTHMPAFSQLVVGNGKRSFHPKMDAPLPLDHKDFVTSEEIEDIISDRSMLLSREGIMDLIQDFPEIVVEWLYSLSITEEDVLDTMKKVHPAVAYALKLQEDILTRDADTV